MSGAAARKIDHHHTHTSFNDNEARTARRRMIATQAEEACGLPGNLNTPDYDLFEKKYGLTDFA